jgi:hypothetical protein
MVLPPPAHVRATVSLGDATYIDLPTPNDLVDIDLLEPPDGLLPVYEHVTPGVAERTTTRPGGRRIVTTSIIGDTGEVVHPTNGMVWREVHDSVATITADDPLSLECVENLTVMRRRAGIETRAVATGRLTASATHWKVEATLTAYEDNDVVFDRSWSTAIERDHM